MSNNERSGASHIVCVGASAGGLEAIEAFFTNMPASSGLGFVVIQHLSPDHKSLMVEILSKKTEMPVQRAEDSVEVEAGRVYLIPPKKNLTIFHGKLLLQEQEQHRGINLPIDLFLRSLAEDQEEKAVAVILSGSGSDGMRGVRAVKQAGGMIMVQDPATAQFDGMPRAALSTGMADFVLPPEQMPSQLIAFTEHPHVVSHSATAALTADEDGMSKIFALLRERCKVDFTYYKPNTVLRRVDRRMTINQLETTQEYYDYLKEYPTEVGTLFRELLIGVTSFFRDPPIFAALRETYVPELIDAAADRELRVWVPGCSTGEEAYTIAILIKDGMEEMGVHRDVKIFATDIDRDALQFAAAGSYPESIAADIPDDLLSKYFFRREGHFQVSRTVREMVVFAQHNIIKDPPFTSMDLISCRNLLIYLQPVLQEKVLQFFQFSLRRGGLLLLGSSESLGEAGKNLETVDAKAKLFRSKARLSAAFTAAGGSSAGDTRFRALMERAGAAKAELRDRGDRVLERFLEAISPELVPAGVIVNEELEVLHVVGDAAPYMRFPTGRPTLQLDRIVVKELAIPIITGTQKVFREGRTLRFTGIRLENVERPVSLDLKILLLEGHGGRNPLAAILIEEQSEKRVPTAEASTTYDLSQAAEERIGELEQELQFSKENLQATIEELETANEELQATNEELLASNEELQSTNEELQSTNEELFTVNTEYNSKIIELSELTNDVQNLFGNSDLGLLILDENLEVRRFSPAMGQLLDIEERDVGRPLHRLTGRLRDFDLFGTVRECAEASGRCGWECEWEVETEDSKWFLLRAGPYAVGPEEYSGLVLFSVEITRQKRAEAALREQEKRYRLLVESTDAIPWEYSIPDDAWTYVAPQVEATLGYPPDEWKNYEFWMECMHPEDRNWASEYCAAASSRGESHVFEYRFRRKDGEYVWLRDLVTVEMSEGKPVILRGFMIDISERRAREEVVATLLAEKELLLRELRHRVKNNLSTLSSLLSLQAGFAEEEAVRESLRNAQERVETINFVHELLEADMIVSDRIEVGEYLDRLSHRILDASAAQSSITLETDLCRLTLPKDTAAALGMAVHELLYNALKYAFPENREGTIAVRLECHAERASLVVRDNGVGMGGPKPRVGAGLGLTLVRNVAEQFGGTVSMNGTSGTEVRIEFPHKKGDEGE
ncbi:MAG: chemotaxis protein CheB [Spirochaetaceae bacterium]